MDFDNSGTLETEKDLGPPPKSIVKRWTLELKFADKREGEWRKKASKVWKKYRQEKQRVHSYNILWANTETLRPAIYNSSPKPDVRRRFKDKDPLGKSVSEVLRRALEYGWEESKCDPQIINAIDDFLLPGRGVVRVRYVPRLVGAEETEDPTSEQLEGDIEELEWEQAPLDHVQWDDLRIGTGKTWDEVSWVGFRHRFTKDELKERFPDHDVPLRDADDDEVQAEKSDEVKDLFKTAEVWEIWNKEKREVIFLCLDYKDAPLDILPDPLRLVDFFPIPRPLYAIEDSCSTVPIPLYELYREQAEEIDRISDRINKIVKGMKLRGIYDASLKADLSEVMRGEDNDLIPSENAMAIGERGGLEKAIWMLPIEQGAKVLEVLYQQREQAKQVVYEITGISDILRGSTEASETATAQQIKSQWGSIRLKRMQQEIQRFIRDLIRLQAEVIADRFQVETLSGMTGLQFPTAEQKQQMVLQMQQSGQQQELPPSWDEIIQVLRSDTLRTYKVDIETDSIVAASMESDMQGLSEVLTALSNTSTGLMEAVQAGMLPVEAVKEIMITVCRRSRMGNAIEDALDSMHQPAAQPQEQDNSLQVEQMKQQAAAQQQQQDQAHEAQIKQMEMQQESALKDKEMAYNAQTEQMKAQIQATLDTAKMDLEKWKAQLDSETKLAIAQLSAQTTMQTSQLSSETDMKKTELTTGAPKQLEEVKGQQKVHGDLMTTVFERLVEKLDEMNQPKVIERDKSGRVVGVSVKKAVAH